MKLDELRTLLAERSDGETTLAERDAVKPHIKHTLEVEISQTQLYEGCDVVLSDDPEPEALNFARKCGCGRMREVKHEAGSSVHVILPCEVCTHPVP